MAGDFINLMAKSVGSGLASFASQSAKAAGAANAVSKQAQTDQGNFNRAQAAIANTIGTDRLAEQYAFNSGQAASANQFTSDMWDRAAAWNEDMFERMMKFNHDEAQLNRDFQERMRNTAYQAAVKDMETAGLNPVLAVTGGGISTGSGSGSAASVSAPSMSGASGAMGSGGLLNGISSSESSYTGQMQYMGGLLGLMSAIIASMGTAYKTASQMPAGEQFLSSLMDFIQDDNRWDNLKEGYKDKFYNIFDQQHLESSNGKGQRGRSSGPSR